MCVLASALAAGFVCVCVCLVSALYWLVILNWGRGVWTAVLLRHTLGGVWGGGGEAVCGVCVCVCVRVVSALYWLVSLNWGVCGVGEAVSVCVCVCCMSPSLYIDAISTDNICEIPRMIVTAYKLCPLVVQLSYLEAHID